MKQLLTTAYAAFNARDIDATFSTMAANVAWPKAFKGGFARGHQEVRAYWTEQWSEIDLHVEPVGFSTEADGRIAVKVHQILRDLTDARYDRMASAAANNNSPPLMLAA